MSDAYQAAGVDIRKADAFIHDIKPIIAQTHNPSVLNGIGGFAAHYELPSGYQNPVLVSCTDGVGTKLKLAIELRNLTGLGQDLVAMCVNDLLVCGAEPLYFLDYFATESLSTTTASTLIQGMAAACAACDCALIGGETAEMPGLYQPGDFDLAGFAVGIVEKHAIIDGCTIQPGQAIIGIGSNGAHANGFSLIRQVLAKHSDPTPLLERFDWLAPTVLYAKLIRSLKVCFTIHGMAHITGGGLFDNIPRVLPASVQASIQPTAWPMPEMFQWLAKQAGLTQRELYQIFNVGIGYVCIVDATEADEVIRHCHAQQHPAWIIGQIEAREQPSAPVVLRS